MKHLQKLLLSLLLVTCPPATASKGGEAKTHSTPYVAYLQGKNNHFCGGFLVAPNWVMTAAQCFGDAGDPLVCNNKAYGIFSYRHNNWPGFYTHIAPYLPWVNSVMKSA
uniref:Peptidase S1 domain-containing protein n=1 Tax=Aquila chrysaetos chrysaetos TaxID=223781 RepID=A0A663DUN3_AQUCH